MKLAGDNLRGHANHDGTISFKCDDCTTVYTFSGLYPGQPLVTVDVRAWSITQRKQRCPDCTVIAREKGWVA